MAKDSGEQISDLQAVEQLSRSYQTMAAGAGQGHRRAGGGRRAGADRHVLPGACAAGRRAGAGQDAAGQHDRDVLHLSFKRIQFTPDLMPSDITGTDVLEEDRTTGKRVVPFVHGPLFANMVLADEINRTPPKTQAALLEAMQEHQVTAGEHDVRAARAVLRAGDAEPDRAGRHVSAARGAARPLHVHDDWCATRRRRTKSRS